MAVEIVEKQPTTAVFMLAATHVQLRTIPAKEPQVESERHPPFGAKLDPMAHINFEFKARFSDEKRVRAVLKELRARFLGTDHQVDTYFAVPSGRLKLREGRIENALIFYKRLNARRARLARVEIMLLPRRNSLRKILASALGVLVVVKKRREIYFVGSVKVHLDQVRGLGKFLEVEAISQTGAVRKARLQAQKFMKLFGVSTADIIPESYSDLVISRSGRQ
ncbi:MAG TPA: class IV adenylate cyclase [Terriglobia bacterium]|nr:class IV adenylate cyclase [Terriglobia bacterium]